MASKYPKITDVVNKFFEDSQAEVEGRYQSWNYCYDHFQKLFKQSTLTDNDKDHAALMLGFYLASWGMYRGSSFLLKNYTYTIHKYTVEYLFNKKKKKDFFKNQFIQENEKEKLFELYEELEKHYKKLKQNISKEINVSISQTLITKILMGVCGIIPAYDRNVRRALAELGQSQTLNRKSYSQLLNFYHTNNKEIQSLSSNKKYPPMKILDIYLWKWGGQLLDAERKRNH